MKIILRTVGGFTGRAGADVRAIDVDRLPAAEGRRFRHHLEEAALQDLPPRLLKPAPQSWDFVRHLRVEEGDTVREIQFHDEAAPPALRALVDAIETWEA